VTKAVKPAAVKGDVAAKAAVKDGADTNPTAAKPAAAKPTAAKPTAAKGGGRSAPAARAVVAARPRAKSVKTAGLGAGKGNDGGDGSSADDFE
jgi:hypothetical protein